MKMEAWEGAYERPAKGRQGAEETRGTVVKEAVKGQGRGPKFSLLLETPGQCVPAKGLKYSKAESTKPGR